MLLVRELVVRTFKGFYEVRAPALASSISYFALTTIAPLAVIALWVGNLVLGAQAARESVSSVLGKLLGTSLGAEMVEFVGARAQPQTVKLTGIVSILLLIYGATSLFGALRQALDAMWRVRVLEGPEMARHRRVRALVLFFAVFLPAFALVAMSTALRMVNSVLGSIPGLPIPAALLAFVTSGVAVLSAWAVIALLLRVLPDARLGWKSIAVGSGFTAVTWTVADWGFALYLSKFSLASKFGAAGAFVALLVWIFLMARLLLAGALMSYEHAQLVGERAEPREWAELY